MKKRRKSGMQRARQYIVLLEKMRRKSCGSAWGKKKKGIS